jgi:hypothetical protein
MWSSNRDGLGIILVKDSGDHKSIDVMQTLDKEEGWRLYSDASNEGEIVLHYRFGTHGTKDIRNVHPFKFDGGWVVHNGIFSGFEIDDKSMSDTAWWVKNILNPMYSYAPDDFMKKNFELLSQYFIAQSSKGVVVETDGTITLLNDKAGTWDGGRWFSNYGFRAYENTWQGTSTRKTKPTKVMCCEANCDKESEVRVYFDDYFKGFSGNYCLNCAVELFKDIEISRLALSTKTN